MADNKERDATGDHPGLSRCLAQRFQQGAGLASFRQPSGLLMSVDHPLAPKQMLRMEYLGEGDTVRHEVAILHSVSGHAPSAAYNLREISGVERASVRAHSFMPGVRALPDVENGTLSSQSGFS